MKLKLRSYQTDAIRNINKQLAKNNKVCFAASCGSGKTITSIAFIESYLEKNPGSKVLVLTHGQVILRNQYITECDRVSPNFKYAEVNSTNRLTKKIYKKNDVIILIPQSLRDYIPKFDLIIVDEAHQFYFATKKGKPGMVQKIIQQSGAKQQVALTGTPSPYINNNWPMVSIPMDTLFPDHIEDVVIELAASSYLVKFSDYNLTDGDIRKEKEKRIFHTQATVNTLDSLLDFIYKRLKVIWKTHPTVAKLMVKGKPDWITAFKALQDTMIACKSQDQARDVKTYFDSKGVISLLSISKEENALDAQRTFKKFKEDPKTTVLIVVGRGILGFNHPELANVVDMTCSSNVDRVFQLMSRLVRKSKKVPQKLFLKIVPDLFKNYPGYDYFLHFMTAVMSMTHEYWFTRFNGHNFLQLKIPDLKKKSGKGKRNGKGSKKPKNQQPVINTFLGLPAIQFFKGLWHKNERGTSSYSFTTLGKVRKDLMGINYCDPITTRVDVKNWIKVHAIKVKA